MSLLLTFGVLVWWLRFLFADGLTLIGESASRVERRGVIGVDFWVSSGDEWDDWTWNIRHIIIPVCLDTYSKCNTPRVTNTNSYTFNYPISSREQSCQKQLYM